MQFQPCHSKYPLCIKNVCLTRFYFVSIILVHIGSKHSKKVVKIVVAFSDGIPQIICLLKANMDRTHSINKTLMLNMVCLQQQL